MVFKGLAHVHTNYSFDGKLNLSDYIEFARKNKISFILFAEHFDTFTEERYEKYKNACKKLSDNKLLLIPGIEYSAENGIHILGFGIDKYIPANNIDDIVRVIRQTNGLASYSHPVHQNFKYHDKLAGLDAIEIHNSKYDGVLSARYKSYLLYEKLKERKPGLSVTCGTDYHKFCDFESYVYLYVDLDKIDKNKILDQIKNKNCKFGNDLIKYNIEKLNIISYILMTISEYIYLPVRNLKKRARLSLKRRLASLFGGVR